MKFDVTVPPWVAQSDGPRKPLSTRGTTFSAYGFGIDNVELDQVEAKKAELIEFFKRWLIGYIAGRGIVSLEWRLRPTFTTSKTPECKGDPVEMVNMRARCRVDFVAADPADDYALRYSRDWA